MGVQMFRLGSQWLRDDMSMDDGSTVECCVVIVMSHDWMISTHYKIIRLQEILTSQHNAAYTQKVYTCVWSCISVCIYTYIYMLYHTQQQRELTVQKITSFQGWKGRPVFVWNCECVRQEPAGGICEAEIWLRQEGKNVFNYVPGKGLHLNWPFHLNTLRYKVYTL